MERQLLLFCCTLKIPHYVICFFLKKLYILLSMQGSCKRSFRGHNGPVSTLSDKLLGDDGSGKLLASGGEDGTVRLWSFCSGRGQHALKATVYGHEKSIKLISVAGYVFLWAEIYNCKLKVVKQLSCQLVTLFSKKMLAFLFFWCNNQDQFFFFFFPF